MKRVCLCLKIHIPAIPVSYRYSDTNRSFRYYDEDKIKSHVRLIYTQNILPFFEMIRKTHWEHNNIKKVGLSISGTSLMLLQKHAPEAILLLNRLKQNECIEIFSEPWSHSIVPFFSKKTLIEQTNQHDEVIHSFFGDTPEVFIVHSPEYLLHFPQTLQSLNKKVIFTNFNHISYENYRKFISNKKEGRIGIPLLPINYKLSQILQKIDSFPFLKSSSRFVNKFIKKFRNSVNGDDAVILVYNITSGNAQYPLSRSIIFRKIMTYLLNEPEVVFQPPSELAEETKDIAESNTLFSKFRKTAKLPELWLKNKNQNEIFKKQLRINTLMLFETNSLMIRQWNLLQDMEHLYYMNEYFNDKKYAGSHFNPYPTPEKAFINYNNILYDFIDRLEDKIRYRRKEFGRLENKIIPEKSSFFID